LKEGFETEGRNSWFFALQLPSAAFGKKFTALSPYPLYAYYWGIRKNLSSDKRIEFDKAKPD
jgi:hypothetical protein